MKETELKFKVKSFSSIRTRLKKLGGKLLWSGTETDLYFDNGRYLRNRKSMLRVRNWPGHGAALTFKVKKANKKYKIVRELEVAVSDFNLVSQILSELGFKEIRRYQKQREHWELKRPRAHVELDQLRGLRIVEIEATPAVIKKLAEQLGLDFSLTTTKDYLSILESGF